MANDAEEKKRNKYACPTSQFQFVTVAVETLGALGEEAENFFRELGRRITAVTGEMRATEFLFQRLSVAIQRGNVSSVLGTVDSMTDCQNLDVVHYL